MNNAFLTVVIATLKKIGITPDPLPIIKPLEIPRITAKDIAEAITDSTHKDPFEDPHIQALVSQMVISDQRTPIESHYRNIQETARIQAFKDQADQLLEQIHAKFEQHAESIERLAPLVGRPNSPSDITDDRLRVTAAQLTVSISQIEDTIKAWREVWAFKGQTSYGNNNGLPFMFMNVNKEQWRTIRLDDPTVWNSVRKGAKLTLADSPKHVGERYQTMIHSEQLAYDEAYDKNNREQGAKLLRFVKG